MDKHVQDTVKMLDTHLNVKKVLATMAVALFFYVMLFPMVVIQLFMRVMVSSFPMNEVKHLGIFQWNLIINQPYVPRLIIVSIIALTMVFISSFNWMRKRMDSTSDAIGQKKPPRSETGEYGNARYGLMEELEAQYDAYDIFPDRFSESVKGDEHPGGFVLSSTPILGEKKINNKGKKEVRAKGLHVVYIGRSIRNSEHTITLGGTGAGKSTGSISPSIISISHAGSNLAITDPKLELYNLHAGQLREMGYNVILLNYANPTCGQQMNFLEYINQQYDKGLPALYTAKACEEFIRFIHVMRNDENSLLYRVQKKAKSSSNAPDIIELASIKIQENDRYNFNFAEFNADSPGQDFIDFLHEFLLIAQADSVEEVKNNESEDTSSRNIYLQYRTEQIIAAGLQVLDGINKENIASFLTRKTEVLKKAMESLSEDSYQYTSDKLKIEDCEAKIQMVQEAEDLTSEIILMYLEELRQESMNIYTALEQEASSTAQEIATMIVESNSKSTESIWVDGPIGLLSSLILFVCRESHDKSARNLGTIYRILSDLKEESPGGSNTFDKLMTPFLTSDQVKLLGATAAIAPDRTKASIITSLIAPLRLWANEAVVSQSSKTTLNFEDLDDPNKKTAIFLNIPGADVEPIYGLLGALFVEQLYKTMSDMCAAKDEGCLSKPLYLMLEELGNMPAIPTLGPKLSLARSKNIRFHMVIQSLSQLEERYPDEYNNILENTNILYLLTNLIDTAKWVSDRVGNYTGINESLGSSESDNGTFRTSINHSKIAVPLYTTTELLEFEDKHGLYIHTRAPSTKVELYPNYQWPNIDNIRALKTFDANNPRPYEPNHYFIPSRQPKDTMYYLNHTLAYMRMFGTNETPVCCLLDSKFLKFTKMN